MTLETEVKSNQLMIYGKVYFVVVVTFLIFQNLPDVQVVFKAGAKTTSISDLITVCQDMRALT